MSTALERPPRHGALRRFRRWTAGIVGALFLLSAGLAFEDPTCPHHGAGGDRGGPHATSSAHGHAPGAAGDEAPSHRCTCAGACHGSSPALGVTDVPGPVLAQPGPRLVVGPRARDEALPPPPDHLLPFAHAPPRPLPT